MRRLPIVVAQLEADFERLRHEAGLSVDFMLLEPFGDDLRMFARNVGMTVDEHALGPIGPKNPTLGEVYQRYIDDPTHAWTASTRQAYETTRRVAVSVLGSEMAIADLSRSDVRGMIEVLRYLPKNSTKLFPELSLREAADHAQTYSSISRISTSNANAYLGNFSSFLNWCVREEVIGRNPGRGLRLPDEVAQRKKRHPFSTQQLKLIFNAPLFTGCADGERGYAKAGRERPRNARFWVPLLALHTGMRLNEICQLDTTDIRTIDGVTCIVVTRTSMVGSTDKTLKTDASERIIPVHPTLLDLGLAAFADNLRCRGQAKLFDDIDSGSRGVRAVAFSKWFTQFMQACGAKRERTSFHSFRHNFQDELRISRVDHDVGMALAGWTDGRSRSSAVSESYGRGYRVGALREAVIQLTFADIDLSHIRG